MSQLSVILQEPFQRETRTILALLREQMNGVDRIRTPTRRRSLKERLGLKSMGCCGTTWSFRPNTINLSDSEDEEQHHEHQQEDEEATNQVQIIDPGQVRSEITPDRDCLDQSLIGSGMNLAAALAAERHYRAAEGSNNTIGPSNNENGNAGSRTGTAPGTPLRVSLMRLLAESNGCDGEGKAGGGEVGSSDTMCCVCMGRKKGAAFIPCGHTFCRVCSRELWLNRGSCPLCNRSILDILDIF
ncbi:hypothetical protein Patl1_09841 [Pistacia atlantica]|uniref:Uncharacterized protein n=1 Tax=Pistacia atlantica TaxID=434234 RepID=A0ACC1A2A4_9ROSI|nr:hypothetical protein Patl1_09841 [Pistacia atlantica]